MIILGSGGFATQLLFNLSEINELKQSEIIIYTDPQYLPIGNKYLIQHQLISDKKELYKILENHNFLIAFSNPSVREKLKNQLVANHGIPTSFISSKSIISNYVTIGIGSIILANTLIEPNCQIGEYSIINSGVQIFHDSILGEFVELGPGSTLTGGSQIGSRCVIGANATILPKVKICDNVIIGANSTVTKDILSPGTYVGSPALKIK